MLNINLSRSFTGPRHAKLEEIWRAWADAHKDQVQLHIFENPQGRLLHDICLQAMWAQEKKRPEPRAVFTEFDLLPYPSLAQWVGHLNLVEPVEAAEYCTRDPGTKKALWHGLPAPWVVRVQKSFLKDNAVLSFWRAGQFNDPCHALDTTLQRSSGQKVRLIKSEDDYPNTYGVRVPGAGLHLFWSRNYNSSPDEVHAGIRMADVFAGVDKAIEGWKL